MKILILARGLPQRQVDALRESSEINELKFGLARVRWLGVGYTAESNIVNNDGISDMQKETYREICRVHNH